MAQPTDREELGKYVLDKLKNSVHGDSVYADLSGVVLDEAGYQQKLEEDREFAQAQVDRMFRIPPPTEGVKGISPAEQRTIAKFVHSFAKNNPDIPKPDLLKEFFARNETLNGYSSEDLKKVASTLRFEYRMDVPLPGESDNSGEGSA